ncbi:MAG TPA: biotin/lipoyl-containing protein [bacterium]|nr:biotin/lipoyl-containing protein [bacterium]
MAKTPIVLDQSLFREDPEVELIAWLAEDETVVEADQAIAQISTAKVIVEIASPTAGQLRRLRQPHDLIHAGEVIGVIEHD